MDMMKLKFSTRTLHKTIVLLDIGSAGKLMFYMYAEVSELFLKNIPFFSFYYHLLSSASNHKRVLVCFNVAHLATSRHAFMAWCLPDLFPDPAS
jgi:hypothetical protein